MWVLLVLCSALAVKCAPNFQVGGLIVPLGAAPGQNGSSYDVKMTGGGLQLQRHKERHTERTDHREERENDTMRDDKDPNHISESESKTTKTHDSQEALQQTEDSGVKLGWSGVQLYNDTSNVADRSSADTERGSTRERSMDKSANARHLSSSGSQYTRSRSSRDHHEDRQHTAIDLNGDFTKYTDTFANTNVGDMFDNMGKGCPHSGDVLTKTGRGKGGNATRETMTLDTHEGTKEENGSSWKKTKDYVKDGNQTNVKTTDQTTNHTAASKDSSKNETHEKEIKVIKGEDDKANEEIKNDGHHTDRHSVCGNDGQEKSKKQGNVEPSTSDVQEKSNKQGNVEPSTSDVQEKSNKQGNVEPSTSDVQEKSNKQGNVEPSTSDVQEKSNNA